MAVRFGLVLMASAIAFKLMALHLGPIGKRLGSEKVFRVLRANEATDRKVLLTTLVALDELYKMVIEIRHFAEDLPFWDTTTSRPKKEIFDIRPFLAHISTIKPYRHVQLCPLRLNKTHWSLPDCNNRIPTFVQAAYQATIHIIQYSIITENIAIWLYNKIVFWPIMHSLIMVMDDYLKAFTGHSNIQDEFWARKPARQQGDPLG
ncbi:hypothetical protein B0H16DRAFT_1463841 [Mycena metata]|uniref:Uncharacterized protein n=1 Tax=Mycena metata TaxID=1033252 RepID=A0AAD7IHQ4_9AGAR|nr:hypothetical protein B0H16DRAFT_1463841 [Mycena metata]